VEWQADVAEPDVSLPDSPNKSVNEFGLGEVDQLASTYAVNPDDPFWEHRCQRFVPSLRDKFNDADLTICLAKRFSDLREHRPVAKHFLAFKDNGERFDAPYFINPKSQPVFRQA
jgi:hypothetical protein